MGITDAGHGHGCICSVEVPALFYVSCDVLTTKFEFEWMCLNSLLCASLKS